MEGIEAKQMAIRELNESEEFILSILKEERVHCVTNVSKHGSVIMLFNMLNDFCDMWGDVVTSEMIVQFLMKRPSLTSTTLQILQKEKDAV